MYCTKWKVTGKLLDRVCPVPTCRKLHPYLAIYILSLKLQKHTNEEIAQRLQCSERTVRRMLKKVQQQLERLVAVDD